MESDSITADIPSKLPRVRLDDTLTAILLLNDQPIVAVASNVLTDEPASGRGRDFCHIVRIDDDWSEA